MAGFFSWYCMMLVDVANHRHRTLDLHQKGMRGHGNGIRLAMLAWSNCYSLYNC
ncbi:unnamed protein product [Urochloa humidicola]